MSMSLRYLVWESPFIFVSKCNMAVLFLLFLGLSFVSASWSAEDAPNKNIPSIYFNPWTNESVPILMSPGEDVKLERYSFGRLPCSCSELTCGCCGGVRLAAFNFERRACMNLTYDPYEFAIGLNMLMNEESLFQNRISAKNPPPACIPVPTPLPVLPNVDFCIRLYNVFTPTPGYNLHACVNFETRLQRAPILVLEFDCMRMGSSGLALLKPDENGGLTTSTEMSPQEGEDEYDEVTEDKKNSTVPVPVSAAPTTVPVANP